MVNQNKTRNSENYTPERYIKLVKKVFGEIDLDPTSCEEANKIVNAKRFFTKEDNALIKSWKSDSLFMNPPYEPNLKPFVDKFVQSLANDEVKNEDAIVLINASTETKAFQRLSTLCNGLCLTDHRIHYISPGRTNQNPTQGSAFFYFGYEYELFKETFQEIGKVWH